MSLYSGSAQSSMASMLRILAGVQGRDSMGVKEKPTFSELELRKEKYLAVKPGKQVLQERGPEMRVHYLTGG